MRIPKGVGYNRAQAIAAATYNKMGQTHPDMQKLSNKPEATKIKVKK